MVKQRIGWKRNYSDQAKRRFHNNECPACGKPKSEWTRRTSWTCCSKKCSEKFYKDECAIQDWSVVRLQTFKRDNYTCKYCGKKFASASELIGDHIIPIAVGGEEFDIDNVQTLYIQCNKIKTKRDANRIAKHRRREKESKYDGEMVKVKFPIQKELGEIF